MLLVLIVAGLGWRQINDIKVDVNIKRANLMDGFTRQVLEDLPQYSVVIIGDDLAGSILYQQAINQVRTDVIILPVTWQRRFEWTKKNLDYWGWEFADSSQQMANVAAWNIYRDRRVFVFGLDPRVLERIGIDGNPFYAAPFGYSMELTTKPQLPPDGKYGITETLSRIRARNLSLWDQGLLGFFSMQHSLLGYVHWKLGFQEPANLHWYLAENLAQFPENKEMISKLKDQPLETALFKSQPQPYIWWMEQAITSTKNQNWQDAYFQAERATLLAPIDQKARELMWEIARKSNAPDADIHYQILNAYAKNQVDEAPSL